MSNQSSGLRTGLRFLGEIGLSVLPVAFKTGVFVGAFVAAAVAGTVAKHVAINHGVSPDSAMWVNAFINAVPFVYYGARLASCRT
jgi:hypothetical protein